MAGRAASPHLFYVRRRSEQCIRIASAARMIAPLQDAMDLDIASKTGQVRLDEWKRYPVMLNRLDISDAPGIDWPSAPSS
ncbi:tail fiber assembly protein [Serratia plymuthica]|uniref:tail fiber assembly protein n=2 Tax=Serratia plymuthica TaxID=82996 RepID=UPI003DA58EDB